MKSKIIMVREKDGYKYSLQPFEEYKFRAKFVAEDIKGKQLVNIDVYTTNPSKYNTNRLLLNSTIKKYGEIDEDYSKIVNWSTREHDDLQSKFLDELLKELDDETK